MEPYDNWFGPVWRSMLISFGRGWCILVLRISLNNYFMLLWSLHGPTINYISFIFLIQHLFSSTKELVIFYDHLREWQKWCLNSLITIHIRPNDGHEPSQKITYYTTGHIYYISIGFYDQFSLSWPDVISIWARYVDEFIITPLPNEK